MTAPCACYRDMLYELKAAGVDANAPDVFNGLQYLKLSMSAIYRKLGIRFQPFIETKQYNGWDINANEGIITLPETLFNLEYVTNGDGVPLEQSKYTTIPPLSIPFNKIQVLSDQSFYYAWYKISGSAYPRSSNVQVRGTWGWHDDYSNAWADTLDSVLDNPMSVGSYTILVDDVSGTDIYGRSPRFSPGQLLKVDSEYMELTMADSVTNTLTVLRGANGSVSNQHNQGSKIYVWEMPSDTKQAIVRFACYPYKRRGDFRRNETDGMGGVIQLPSNIPGDVLDLLQNYANGVPL